MLPKLLVFHESQKCHVIHPNSLISASIFLLRLVSLVRAQLCPTVCNPMNCSPPGSSVHGVLQARILEWVAPVGSPRGSSQPKGAVYVSCIAGGFLTAEPLGNSFYWITVGPAAAAKSRQSCLTLCDSIDGSPPGSPVPGILRAKTLEWVAISLFNA